jgi:hypothetical protein
LAVVLRIPPASVAKSMRPPDRRLVGAREQVPIGLVDLEDQPVAVDGQGFRGGVGQPPEPLLRRPQRRLGTGPLGDLALGRLEQPGVVEGDRGQLGQPRHDRDLAVAELPGGRPRCEPQHADDGRAGGHTGERADDAGRQLRITSPPVVVAGDGLRPTGLVDEPGQTVVE